MTRSAKNVIKRYPSARTLSQSPAWQALALHQAASNGTRIRDLFEEDPGRTRTFSLDVGALHLDYSKQRVKAETMRLLAALAIQTDLPGKIAAMYSGSCVNYTEHRPALHTALRADDKEMLDEIKDSLGKGQSALLMMGATGDVDEMAAAFEKYHPTDIIRHEVAEQTVEDLKAKLEAAESEATDAEG